MARTKIEYWLLSCYNEVKVEHVLPCYTKKRDVERMFNKYLKSYRKDGMVETSNLGYFKARLPYGSTVEYWIEKRQIKK